MSTPQAIYRQGDVLLIHADSVPEAAKPIARDQGRVVLAYGEVTGHAHAVLDRGAELLAVPDAATGTPTADAAERWLRVTAPAVALVHEEHATITVPSGTYQVVRQREYVPGPLRSRAVAD